MANLRDLKNRISSVKSTRKITSAMKMVAASKLKKAQAQAEASQPYATKMVNMIQRLAKNALQSKNGPRLLLGTGAEQTYLFVVVTSDRGLCGGFNGNLIRKLREKIRKLEAAGKSVKILCAGRKGYDALRRDLESHIVGSFTDMAAGGKKISFAQADEIADLALDLYGRGEFDVCKIVYNEFQSVLVQKPVFQQVIPFSSENSGDDAANDDSPYSPYEFEPDEDAILAKLLPKNIGVQLFRALLDSAAGEQAARMTAMDNATRNAGDMIDDLTLQYNRERQAAITNELIEIISGAEAV